MKLGNPADGMFIVAEAGVNHNGQPDMARKLVEAAAGAGADAVKFQTWITEDLLAPGAPLAPYQQRKSKSSSVSPEDDQYSMLKKLELPFKAFRELKALTEDLGLVFLSTPDEEKSADFLDSMDVAAFKIGSGEITNLPFLKHVAGKGRTIILSTGMATLGEVEEAVRAIEEVFPPSGASPAVVLLHAVTAYPAPAEQYNLKAMATLREAFGYPVGLSDHTAGDEIALAAAALGACVLEKHFTLDTAMEGPDHSASMEPAAFAEMVRRIRLVEQALGDGVKAPVPCERENMAVVRKSLVAGEAVPAGTMVTENMIRFMRPGTGYAPSMAARVIGRRVQRDMAAGEPFTPGCFQPGQNRRNR